MKMNKKIFWYFLSFFVMIVLPFLAVHFVSADNGMAICFILFYAINPMYFAMVGLVAGLNGKCMEEIPYFGVILFLLGIIFVIGSTDWSFAYFCICYIIICCLTQYVGIYLKRRKN